MPSNRRQESKRCRRCWSISRAAGATRDTSVNSDTAGRRPLLSRSGHTVLDFRPLRPSDQDKLWHWLHVALWDPPPAGLRPVEVLQNPAVRIYAEDWGRPSDVGVVARVDGVDAGACWLRLLPAGVGLASIDNATPQLGIALEPQFQHKGHGRPLMLRALAAAWVAGYKRVSLTVHPQNPAQRMYERCGFEKVGIRNTYHLMVAESS